MSRIVIHNENTPIEIKKSDMQDESVWICRCGLSAKQPYCDGSHKSCKEEAKTNLYEYERNPSNNKLTKIERRIIDLDNVDSGCCGSGRCCK